MQFWVNVLNMALIAGLLAVALNVILGVAGQLTLASAGLAGCGAFAAGHFAGIHHWAFVPSLIAGAVAAGVIGGALAIPTLRLRPDMVMWLTLMFGTVIVYVFGFVRAFVRPITFFGHHELLSPTNFLAPIAIITTLGCLICWRVVSSPYGRVLRGVREDDDATSAIGKNVVGYKVATFTLTAAVLGVGGAMLSYYELVLTSANFNFDATTAILATVVVGGLGNLLGSFVGAILLTAISPILQKVVAINPDIASLWQLLIYGVLLVLMIRLRPVGLIPEGFKLRRLVGLGRPPVWAGAAGAGVAIPGAGEALSADQLVGAPGSAGTPASADLEADAVTLGESRAEQVEHSGRGTPEPALRTIGLVKSFGGIHAVRGLDMQLPAGWVTALVGPNGAGKTTVFNLITGRIKPDGGTVLLRGQDITGRPPYRVARRGMARSFQDVRTYRRLSLLDNVQLAVPGQHGEHLAGAFLRPFVTRADEVRARERAFECLAFVGLERDAGRLGGSLAFGDQKLLALARLLATGADILLLDEPASGIDRANLGPVLDAIERLRDEGKTICLVEHNLDVVTRLADHVLFMESGRVIAEGTMESIMAQPRLAEVYFGHAAEHAGSAH